MNINKLRAKIKEVGNRPFSPEGRSEFEHLLFQLERELDKQRIKWIEDNLPTHLKEVRRTV